MSDKKQSGKEGIKMTILVTGGVGFIGSNFIFYMMDRYPEYRIVCLDCLTYAGNMSTLAPIMDRPNFRFVKDRITDREAVCRLFEEERPDMVVNFAAESHVDLLSTIVQSLSSEENRRRLIMCPDDSVSAEVLFR